MNPNPVCSELKSHNYSYPYSQFHIGKKEFSDGCLPPIPWYLHCAVSKCWVRSLSGKVTLTSESGSLLGNLHKISQSPLWLASLPRDSKATSKEKLDYIRARIWEFWHGRAEVSRAHAETRACTYVKTIFPNPSHSEDDSNLCASLREH